MTNKHFLPLTCSFILLWKEAYRILQYVMITYEKYRLYIIALCHVSVLPGSAVLGALTDYLLLTSDQTCC